MNNRKLGNRFEAEFCEILSANGFWAHNMAQNSSGQPADVIAARNKVAYLIDCKVCSGKGFAISRMEDNQDLSMELWKECGNGEGWFALKLRDGRIFMIPHFTIRALRNSKSSINEKEVFEYGMLLEKWITRCK